MSLQLRRAGWGDLSALLPMVQAYHAFEGLEGSDADRRSTLESLLADERLGVVWLLEVDGESIGYLALCFGFSIEFGGRDAFVDEFFIDAVHRGIGHGRAALEQAKVGAASLGVRALHLEVARANRAARTLYGSVGFEAREKYVLMSAATSTKR